MCVCVCVRERERQSFGGLTWCVLFRVLLGIESHTLRGVLEREGPMFCVTCMSNVSDGNVCVCV